MSIFHIFRLPTTTAAIDGNDLLIVGDKSGDQGSVVQATISSVGAAMGAHPGYLTGRTYPTWNQAINQSSAVAAIDTIYFYPFFVAAPITLTAVSMRVVTLGAGSSAKAAIWANSTVSNRPLGAPLLADNTGVTTQASNTTVAFAMTGTLQPGFYWAGTKFTGTLPVCYNIPSQAEQLAFWMGLQTGTLSVTTNALSFADTYSNNMPTMAEGASYTGVSVPVPYVFLVT